MMVDRDNLEHLNDAHGHGCGDRALALVDARVVVEVPCVSGVIRLDEHRAARKGRVSA